MPFREVMDAVLVKHQQRIAYPDNRISLLLPRVYERLFEVTSLSDRQPYELQAKSIRLLPSLGRLR